MKQITVYIMLWSILTWKRETNALIDLTIDPEWLELKRVTEQDGPLYEKIDIVYLKKVPFFA